MHNIVGWNRSLIESYDHNDKSSGCMESKPLQIQIDFVSHTNSHEDLKTVDTIGNCQRPVSSVAVSQHYMHKITTLWKFEFDWSSELRDNYEIKKHPCQTKLCAFRCLISRPQVVNLRSWNQIRGKWLLSQKLRHFRGSSFSQCFILDQPLPITQYQVILSNNQ